MEFILYILAGLAVGFAVGLTGVGGGSLMTPLLLLFGYPAPVAIGTDLLYAGLTKTTGVYFHQRKGNIRWRIMILLVLGSIPVSLGLNLFVMDADFRENENYEALLTMILGVMLILTSLVIIFQKRIQRRISENSGQDTHSHDIDASPMGFARKHTDIFTVLTGMLLGLCVTLSSVGAGAFGAAVLFVLYPRLKVTHIVGTDIAHAVPLTLVAGLGYLYYGLVDFILLFVLLCGSLPGIYLGTHMGSVMPEKLMRYLLAITLLGLGIKFSFLSGH
ncbi:MAG: sulfite exporter TauE/SafE family protein [Pseudomonadales bacterium]|nr:sulfite exporter TauE/SafE family protein [Pseudomonadales bacterium]